jgi:hypothetical protein
MSTDKRYILEKSFNNNKKKKLYNVYELRGLSNTLHHQQAFLDRCHLSVMVQFGMMDQA